MSFRVKLLLLFGAAVAAGLTLFWLLAAPLLQGVAQPGSGIRSGLTMRVLPALLLVAAVGWLLIHRVVRSVDRLSMAAASLSEGDFVEQIAVPSADPLGQLARSLEQASVRLQTQLVTLEAERNHLTTILNSMSEGVLAVDARARITGINPVFKTMFEVSLDPVGRHPLEVIRNVEVSRGIERALRRQRPQQLEVTVGGRVLLARFAPYQRGARVEGVVTVLHDITELRRLERGRREFISNVSHELKTPLTSIQGYAETLLEEEGMSETHRRFIRRIFRNARELSELIDELFKLARLEREQAPLNITAIDLKELMADVRRDFEQRLEEKNLDFQFENRSSRDSIPGARVFLQRVFNNLIENAINYTDRGGVTVTVEEGDGELVFGVRDTGVGIPREDLPRVFERFYRVNKDRSRQTGGRGIGLAIVKHVVRLHGGRVWAESELGRGTTVFVALPVGD